MIQQKLIKTTVALLVLLSLQYVQAAQIVNTLLDGTDIKHRWQDSRYQSHGDGTVTDLVTGLMWKKCSEGLSGNDCATGTIARYTWKGAMERAKSANDNRFAGYTDWRVPNVKELHSLLSRGNACPAINLTVFPNTSDGWYWTSTPGPRQKFDDHKALMVDFHSLTMNGNDRNSSEYFDGRSYKVHRDCSNRERGISVRLLRSHNP